MNRKGWEVVFFLQPCDVIWYPMMQAEGEDRGIKLLGGLKAQMFELDKSVNLIS